MNERLKRKRIKKIKNALKQQALRRYLQGQHTKHKTMKKRITIPIVTLIFLALTFHAQSQQSQMYSQYMFNTVTVNPAYAASMDRFTATLLGRAQWLGFDGGPRTETFNLHGPIKKEKIGVGFSVVNDHIGPINEVGLMLDFAYQIRLSRDKFFSMGVKGGFNFFQAELSNLRTIDEGDPAFADDINGSFLPNIGFGFYYYTNQYYLGLSSPKLLRNSLSKNSIQAETVGKEERHYYLIGGYVFDLTKDIKFKPSGLAKIVKGAPISFDINASFNFYRKFWLGATYRIGDAVSLMAEVLINNNLMLGYAFDYTTSKLTNFNSGTHEVLVSYKFSLSKSRLKSPRYF
ncbi:MAG: hypothetical protein CSA05_00980 [Bacteroidia bacterium]|nr:MAG: hypothetical protein CSA05_00980 [Bacteroidia bacterium]